MMNDLILDIITRQTTYIHVSLPDGRTLIYDVSDCDKITVAPPAPDGTIIAWRGEEAVILEPMNRIEDGRRRNQKPNR